MLLLILILLAKIKKQVGFSNGRDRVGRAAHVLCEGKRCFGVREGVSQGVCGYL